MDSIEVYVWLIVFIVLTAIEMATFQLVTIWFAVGAVAAFITSLFSTSLEIQLIVFLAVSMLLLILVRPSAGRCWKILDRENMIYPVPKSRESAPVPFLWKKPAIFWNKSWGFKKSRKNLPFVIKFCIFNSCKSVAFPIE